MHRNLHREIGIKRLEGRRVVFVIEVVKPHALLQWRLEHWRVVRTAERSEARRKRAHTGIAVNLQIENLHSQRVTRLRTFHVERPCQRIVSLRHAQRVARFAQPVAKAVQRICVENIP